MVVVLTEQALLSEAALEPVCRNGRFKFRESRLGPPHELGDTRSGQLALSFVQRGEQVAQPCGLLDLFQDALQCGPPALFNMLPSKGGLAQLSQFLRAALLLLPPQTLGGFGRSENR